MEMLHIAGLYKRFGNKNVLNGLNLNVPEHSIFGFIGKNGAGKTTTMKIILGLLKAEAGEILVNGEKAVYGESPANRFIGYLPDVPAFYSFMTAAEYLRFCGKICGMEEKANDIRCHELLELVGLEKETHRIKGYSRGMKQRLGIAQALLNQPKLLICDEPTSALDAQTEEKLRDELLKYKGMKTIIAVTHRLSTILEFDRVLVLHGGKIVEEGRPRDLMNRASRFRKMCYAQGLLVSEID